MFKVIVLVALFAIVQAGVSPVQINAAEPLKAELNPEAKAVEHDTDDLERSESGWGWGLKNWGWGYPTHKVHYYPVYYPKVHYYPVYTHSHEHYGHHEHGHHEHHDHGHHGHYYGHESHYKHYPVYKKWWW